MNLNLLDGPSQRFYLQREALKKGDLATVRRIAQEAREEIQKRRGISKPGDWELAKVDVEKMVFPNEVGQQKNSSGSHFIDKTTSHQVISYELTFPPLRGYELIGYYDFCPTCRKVRNKGFQLFNNQLNVVYIRELMKHGEIVSS